MRKPASDELDYVLRVCCKLVRSMDVCFSILVEVRDLGCYSVVCRRSIHDYPASRDFFFFEVELNSWDIQYNHS